MQQEYLSKGKELLKILTNNGFDAYFVGEVVRNIVAKIDYKRIDICTSASSLEIKRLFTSQIATLFDNDITDIEDGVIKVNYSDYAFYFETFKAKENKNEDNRSVLSKHYSTSLVDHLSTVNFTINALAMAYSGKITDIYNGKEDTDKKLIRTIANPRQKFNSSPRDMLEAFKIVADIKFNIEKKTLAGIKKRAKSLLNLDKGIVYDDMRFILEAPNAKKAISYMMGSDAYKYIPSLSKGIRLASKLKPKQNINIDELLLLSFVMNGEIDEGYLEYVSNIEIFKKIYNVAITNKKGIYDKLTLFTNGLDVCLEANLINNLIGKDKARTRAIKKAYDALPVKKVCDLTFKGDSILRIADISDTQVVSEIMDEVVFNILEGELHNDYDEIQTFVIKSLSSKGIYYDINRTEEDLKNKIFKNEENVSSNQQSPNYNYNEQSYDNQMDSFDDGSDDVTSRRIRILEQRLDEQSRILQEKNDQLNELENQKVLEIASKMASEATEFIKKDLVISSKIKDLNSFEVEYRNFIINYIAKEKER